MCYAGEDLIDLTAFLANLSGEADRLARIAERLDNLLGELVAPDKASACLLSAEFQEIDALRQALDAICKITSSAASELGQERVIQVSRAALAMGVNLEKVREACLRTQGHHAVPTRSGSPTGDVPFFDEF